MKAAVYKAYGSPEVLHLAQVEKPVPGDCEMLVRIHATAVNSADVRLRKADPFAVRFFLGLKKPKISILGGVFSGIVESVGKNVIRFKIGDAVFGATDMTFGAYAEFLRVPENGTVAIKPENVSFSEAAVIPFGGTTALYYLKKAGVKPGQNVLIYGASGAVGTAAVQLAKYYGAHVTAVCSGANADLVRKLGADQVLDYTHPDFLPEKERFDVMYETVNKADVGFCLKRLNPDGTLILGAAMLSEMLSGFFKSLKGSKKVQYGVIKQTQADMEFLAELVKKGQLKPVIDKTFTLEEIVAAHAYVDGGHKKGNVAITV